MKRGAMLGFHIWADKEIITGDTLTKAANKRPKKPPPMLFPTIYARNIESIPTRDIVNAIP